VLLVILVKDGIHILARAVVALASVAAPEIPQQIIVGDELWIIINGNGLGVVTHCVVAGLCLGAARVTHSCAKHAFETSELGVRTPESSNAKGSGLVADLRAFLVQWQTLSGDFAVLGDEGFLTDGIVCDHGCDENGDNNGEFTHIR